MHRRSTGEMRTLNASFTAESELPSDVKEECIVSGHRSKRTALSAVVSNSFAGSSDTTQEPDGGMVEFNRRQRGR